MRRLVVTASTRVEEIERASVDAHSLELELRQAPAGTTRLDLLRTCSRLDVPVVARFSGLLRTPLVEVAGLAACAEWSPGARLDLNGALLVPFLWSAGYPELRRVLLKYGSVVPAEVLLRPHPGTRSSPRALRILLDLLDAGRNATEGAALARELAAFRFVMTLPDREEGVRAFLEKRDPRFDW